MKVLTDFHLINEMGGEEGVSLYSLRIVIWLRIEGS